jgi:hypothetical protein
MPTQQYLRTSKRANQRLRSEGSFDRRRIDVVGQWRTITGTGAHYLTAIPTDEARASAVAATSKGKSQRLFFGTIR